MSPLATPASLIDFWISLEEWVLSERGRERMSLCIVLVDLHKIYAEYIKARRRAKSFKKTEQGKVMFWCRDNGIQALLL